MSGKFYDLNFEKQVVAITGAVTGFGPFYAETLSEQGAFIVLIDTDSHKVEKEKKRICEKGGKCASFVIENLYEEKSAMVLKKVEAEFGRLDVLVNNPITLCETEENVGDPGWNASLVQLQKSLVAFSRNAGEIMKKNGYGRIVNTFSINGIIDFASQTGYASLRFGIIHATKLLAIELGRTCNGIVVNGFIPGSMETDGTIEKRAGERYPVLMYSPLKRLGRMEELQGALVFLASEAAHYTTAQTISVDGGISCMIL